MLELYIEGFTYITHYLRPFKKLMTLWKILNNKKCFVVNQFRPLLCLYPGKWLDKITLYRLIFLKCCVVFPRYSQWYYLTFRVFYLFTFLLYKPKQALSTYVTIARNEKNDLKTTNLKLIKLNLKGILKCNTEELIYSDIKVISQLQGVEDEFINHLPRS